MPVSWLSLDKIEAHLWTNPETIQAWIARKRMPALKVSKVWRFLASEIAGWVITASSTSRE